MKKTILSVILPLTLTACVTTTNRNQQYEQEAPKPAPEVTLSKIEGPDLRTITIQNVHEVIGPSDLQGLGPKGSNQEILVYLTENYPRTTRMSMIFDGTTKQLMMVKWYPKGETESDFAGLRKRYPGSQILADKKTKQLREVTIVVRGPTKKTLKK